MEQAVKFSIILPVYNVEEYLEECLDSIINQTFKDFEVICINDGSTDNSLQILEQYAKKDSRVKVYTQENQGQGVARNKALDMALGEYIVFVDPDDIIELNALQILDKSFKENNVDIIQFNYIDFNKNPQEGKIKYFSKFIKKKANFEIKDNEIYNWNMLQDKALSNCIVVVWDKAYSTRFLKKYNIKFTPYRYGEDLPVSIPATLIAEKILYISKELYYHRDRRGSAVYKVTDNNFCMFDNLEKIKEFLITNNLYETYKNEYENYLATSLSRPYHYVESKEQYLNKCAEIMSKDKYKIFKQLIKNDLSWKDKIFSIRNERFNNTKTKIITILGFSIKYER